MGRPGLKELMPSAVRKISLPQLVSQMKSKLIVFQSQSFDLLLSFIVFKTIKNIRITIHRIFLFHTKKLL